MSTFKSIVQGKCPKCDTGDIFDYNGNIFLLKAPVMKHACPNCGYRFEKEPGYFIGALYVSYGLAVAEMLAIFVPAYFLFSFNVIFALLISTLLLFSFLNFRYARIIWIYIFQY
jgi:uncharacterized protein (DUF983 family)